MPTCDGNRDAGCEQRQIAAARAWTTWTLACAPISPADPIAGERISAMLPHESTPAGGDCYSGEMKKTVTKTNDVTVISVTNISTGDCANLGSLRAIDLGQLPAGSYRIESPGHTASFTVRPADSDPGDLPEALVLALEVANSHAPGTCFGMPGIEPQDDFAAYSTTRAATQMRKAFPGKTEAERQAHYLRAMRIRVAQDETGAWSYGYTDGNCCTISEMHGSLRRNAAGDIIVGPARTVSSTSVPC